MNENVKHVVSVSSLLIVITTVAESAVSGQVFRQIIWKEKYKVWNGMTNILDSKLRTGIYAS